MRMYRILGAVLIAASLSGEAAWAGRDQTKTVLVVPSRYRVVQFSMDIERLRPTYVVAYGTRSSPTDLALYLWSAQTKEWKEISPAEYGDGSVFDAAAQSLVLVGTEKDMPAGVPMKPNWATKTKRIESLNPAEMANALDVNMRFTPTEWRWLAKRYGMTITDLNTERRRYGKYGPPGTHRESIMQESSEKTPPAVMPPDPSNAVMEVIAPESEKPKFDVTAPPPPAKSTVPVETVSLPVPAPVVVPPKKRPEDK